MTVIRFADAANDDGDFDPYHPDNSNRVAQSMASYSQALIRQIGTVGGWPVSFTLPEPEDDAARYALRLVIATLEQETGNRVIFTSPPGHA